MTPAVLTERAAIVAVLENPAFVPPPAPDGPGATASLRAAMARFSSPDVHAPRRAAVEAALDCVDAARLAALVAERTRARLVGPTVDALGWIARVVPTEALVVCLGSGGEPESLVADVDAVVAVIGRGTATTPAADAAAERLMARFAGHPHGPVAAVSLLYQNCDATAALIAARLAGTTVAAVPRTKRVDGAGAEVTLEIGAADLPFGAGPHRCPGEALAEVIATAVLAEVAASGYAVDHGSVAVDADGRPTRVDLIRNDTIL